MRKEYELVGGRPNPYAGRIGSVGRAVLLDRFLRSEHYVRLDEDVAHAFPDDAVVNNALRLVLKAKMLTRSGRAQPRSHRGRRSV